MPALLSAPPLARAPQQCRRRRPVQCRSTACSAAAASDWQLASAGLAPSFVRLASGIEHAWRTHAALAPLAPLPMDARFAVVDAGAAAERLRIENRFDTSPKFRQCHLELAVGGGGLNVLHCVMYPWAAQDLPLFSVDMVGFGVRCWVTLVALK